MEQILSYDEKQLKEIKEKLLELQKVNPEITDEELVKAYVACVSSKFNLKVLVPVLAELITRVEGTEHKALEFELHTVDYYDEYTKQETTGWYDILAIMKPGFNKTTTEKKYDGIPLYRENISKFDFLNENIILALLESRYNIYDYFKFYYEPNSAKEVLKDKKNLIYSKVSFGRNYYYLEEFMKGLINYRIENNGKKLSKEEIFLLMEYYLKEYNPKPYREREIILRREQ